MSEKQALERTSYTDRKIAKRLARLNGAQERAAFMAELFGRDARREMERLFMIYPEPM